MDAPLRALLVEESAEDAEAILGAICDLPDPCQHRRVSSPEELREALAAFAPDVVLADHAVPGFGDHEALSIVQAHDPLLPFVYVAGTVGEEVAIEAIRRGARWDCSRPRRRRSTRRSARCTSGWPTRSTTPPTSSQRASGWSTWPIPTR